VHHGLPVITTRGAERRGAARRPRALRTSAAA
jgi:hypothetical protein